MSSICAIDANACKAYRQAACVQNATAALASPGARKYKADNAPPCIDALNSAYGNGATKISFSQLVGPGTIGDKCEWVFEGTADKAQPCITDYDCINARICAPAAPGSSTRVCADAMATQTFCANPGDQCPTDTYCSAQTSGGAQCKQAAQAGQACNDVVPCVSSQRCKGGICQARATAGQSCATHSDCSSDTPYCDPYANNICTVGLTFAAGSFDCSGYNGPPVPVDAGVVVVPVDGGGDAPAE